MVHLIVAYNILEVSTVTGQDQFGLVAGGLAAFLNSDGVGPDQNIATRSQHVKISK
ncbi:hypothetical protein [Vreelandella zhaodongensis]|uniref:hypothetical protein n=1 Tax=Vreelandella zhaodongensis TaxID=1176240 RepID=UPI003EB763F8